MKAPRYERGGTPGAVKLNPKTLGTRDDPNLEILTKANPMLIPSALKASRFLTVIEVPYSPENPAVLQRQPIYANKCLKDSFSRGEAPLLTSILYANALNYRVQPEKDMGIISHISWISVCDKLAVYIDFGVTPQMQMSINVAKIRNKKIEFRSIGKIS